MKDPQEIEALASVQHDIWSHWMKYMFTQYEAKEDGSLVIPKDKVNRWKRQTDTAYDALSDKEKESDREQVRKFSHLIE